MQKGFVRPAPTVSASSRLPTARQDYRRLRPRSRARLPDEFNSLYIDPSELIRIYATMLVGSDRRRVSVTTHSKAGVWRLPTYERSFG